MEGREREIKIRKGAHPSSQRRHRRRVSDVCLGQHLFGEVTKLVLRAETNAKLILIKSTWYQAKSLLRLVCSKWHVDGRIQFGEEKGGGGGRDGMGAGGGEPESEIRKTNRPNAFR